MRLGCASQRWRYSMKRFPSTRGWPSMASICGGGKSGKDLVRTINRNPLGTAGLNPEEHRLLGHVESLEFAGYDGANWRESWDTSLSDTNLPSALRVRIQLAGDSSVGSAN